MPKNITLAIPDDLTAEMDKFKEVNWSAVARDAIESYIKRRSNPNLAPILERLASERDTIYNAGYETATHFISTLSYTQMEEVFDAVNRKDEYLQGHLKNWNHYHSKIPLTIAGDQPLAYYKGFRNAIIEVREKLEK